MIVAAIAALIFALATTLAILSAQKKRQRQLEKINRARKNRALRRLNYTDAIIEETAPVPTRMALIFQKRRLEELLFLKELGLDGIKDRIMTCNSSISYLQEQIEPNENINVLEKNDYKHTKQNKLYMLMHFLSRELRLRGSMYHDFNFIKIEKGLVEATIFYAGVSDSVTKGIKDYEADYLGSARSCFERALNLAETNPDQAFHCQELLSLAEEYLAKVKRAMYSNRDDEKAISANSEDGLDRMFQSSKAKESWQRC